MFWLINFPLAVGLATPDDQSFCKLKSEVDLLVSSSKNELEII